MAATTTRPEDRITFPHKLAYGLGGFVNNLLAAAIGGMTVILNLGLGMNPALVGLLGALPRLTDALIDPVMGHISDRTRSRWGRRRPYIFAGAIASGIAYALLWQLPAGRTESFYAWYFLAGSILFYMAYTVYAAPWVALGYELTPDYHERTRLMGVQNFIGQMAYLVAPWFLWIVNRREWFADSVEGARWLAIAIGLVVMAAGVVPALVLRERMHPGVTTPTPHAAERSPASVRARVGEFFGGFATTLKSGPFLRLCAATFLVFNSFIMISSFQLYVIIYYVFGGNQELGARYSGYAGTLGAISTFCVISIVTWMGTRIGKRRAFFVSIGISIAGYLLKWICYDPRYPLLMLLPVPLVSFGLGGLFTLMGAMIADVVDLDELETHQRREGIFGAIYWWVVKLGMAAALAVGGWLLQATGFDVARAGAQATETITMMRLFDAGIPALASALAIWAFTGYRVTEARAGEVRAILEGRRGSGAARPAA